MRVRVRVRARVRVRVRVGVGVGVCVCVFFPTRLFASALRSVPAFQRVACDVGSIHGIFKALKPKWEKNKWRNEEMYPELSS